MGKGGGEGNLNSDYYDTTIYYGTNLINGHKALTTYQKLSLI